jgi:hypothetical protein
MPQTINSENNSLTGQSGTGQFVGSISPNLTGDIDYGDAASLKIINSAAPTVNVDGQIAIDTVIANHKGMATYYSSSQLYALSIPPANLNATTGYAVVYDSAIQAFKMISQVSGSGILVNYAIGSSVVDDSTTSLSYVDTSLTASITPTKSTNRLVIKIFGADYSTADAANDSASSKYIVRRTTGTPADIQGSVTCGYDNSQNGDVSYTPLSFEVSEIAGNTALHTYVLRNAAVGIPASTSIFNGTVCPGRMIIYEYEV